MTRRFKSDHPFKDFLIVTMGIILLTLTVALMAGCSFQGKKATKQTAVLTKNDSALRVRVQENVTGIVDSLAVAPTNAATNLARDLATDTQQIVGLPDKRLPVADILAGLKPALDDLKQRFDQTQALIAERTEMKAKMDETTARLVDMGKQLEAERNKSIVKRIWHWSIGTLGLAGTIAICVFCPAVIPFLIQAVGWLVGKIPQLASVFGVVSKKAFDAVVTGVETARDHVATADPAAKGALEAHLQDATQEGNTQFLVKTRKNALGV